MKIKIKPSLIKGSVAAPPSKSMAHRMLICAGLCEGVSEIENIEYSEDILATLDCLSALGAEIKRQNNRVVIRGIPPSKREIADFYCRESGSTLRFFIPIAALSDKDAYFHGSDRLMERPMEIYEALFQNKGLSYEKSESIKVKGPLKGDTYTLRADVSSQFISGLLFALPLCEKDSVILLEGPFESRNYVDMTIAAMERFGVRVLHEDEKTIYIKGSQKYLPQKLTVEGDWSNSAFLHFFNLVSGDVTVKGLKEDSLQADKVYTSLYKLLKQGNPTIDVSNCPDLAPVLMTAAAVLNGARLTGTRRLSIKESDRGAVMKQELSYFGADIEVLENDIIINKSKISAPLVTCSSHNDHRVVMSLAALMTVTGGEIEGIEAVRKSFPDFFDKMTALGMEAEIYDN